MQTVGASCERANFARVLFACVISLCTFSVQAFGQSPAAGGQAPKAPPPSTFQSPPASIVPACPAYNYTPVPTPPPDQLAALMVQRKRYRLVIGAGEFEKDPGMNRDYVDRTAILIDARLADLGYAALPTLTKVPYLVGKDATHAAIVAALREMALVTSSRDLGVIYYVGHGTVTYSETDLELGVYDQPVEQDQGIRVSDITGILLTDTVSRSDVPEIPNFLLVLDTCYSGIVSSGSHVKLNRPGPGIENTVVIQNQQLPRQMAIMSATAVGVNNQAYELGNTGLSAFGYYFARALKEDWACADKNIDGILTFGELRDYITDRLKLAFTHSQLQGQMNPQILNGHHEFIAYDPSKHFAPGDRDKIITLLFKPAQNQVAAITLPSGNRISCSDPTGCLVPVSASYLNGTITVSSRPALNLASRMPMAFAELSVRSGSNVFAASRPGQTKDTDFQQAQIESMKNGKKPQDAPSGWTPFQNQATTLKALVQSGKQGRTLAGVGVTAQ